MRKVVFKYRPKLGVIYKKNGKRVIADYSRDVYIGKKATNEIVSNAIVKVTEKIFGTEKGSIVRESLQKNNYLSTVDHHGPVCHPSFFQPDLLRTILDKEQGIPATIVLSCASVTLSNHSFPRGFSFHSEAGGEIRLPLFGVRHRRSCVYSKERFSREEGEKFLSQIVVYRKMYDILLPIFSDEHLYILENYRSQVTFLNERLMNKVGLGGSDFISISIEDVVREILVTHHLGTDTFFSRVLFDQKTRNIFLEETNGIQTSHNFSNEHTTVLFWGAYNGIRVSLRIKDSALVDKEKNIHIILDKEHIERALIEEKIFPNLALCLILLSSYGVNLGGGFSQVDYLPLLREKMERVLFRIGKKKHKWGNILFMGGDFMYLPKQFSSDSTLLDVLNNPMKKLDFTRFVKETTVSKAIDAIIPDVYEIISARLKRKNTCLACGNNPTSHLGAWISSALSTWVNPWAQKFFQTYIGRELFYFAEWILNRFFEVFVLLGVMKFDTDPSRVLSSRGRVLFDEAVARGWKIETALVYGRAMDMYRITFPHGKRMYFNGLPRPDIHESPAVGWMDDKALLKKCLEKAGIPVPKGGGFGDWEKAKQCFYDLHCPVIVKPRLGSRGRHTTTNLTKIEDFEKAFWSAKEMGYYAIVEEHLIGSVYRATMIDGVLAGVLAGDPPRITGDGTKTIRELIERKNRSRDKRVSEVLLSDKLNSFLERQDYTLDATLPLDVTIDLSEKIGLSYGGKSREVTPDVHPKLRALLEQAAKVVDDPILGFDFITTDVSLDPDTVSWGIIECNAVPFINLHHDPLEGVPINVAGKLWDYVARKHIIE